MNIYENAEYWYTIAYKSYDISEYRACVFHCCLAAELYLKSCVDLIDPTIDYQSHDIISLYRVVQSKYKPKHNLYPVVTHFRKYFNEARYPSGDVDVYDEKFAKEFLTDLETIKHYVDDECHVSIEDLQHKFRKSK